MSPHHHHQKSSYPKLIKISILLTTTYLPYSSLEAFLLLIPTWYRSILADTTTLLRVLLRLHKVLRLLGFLFKIEENGGRRISLNSAKEPCRRHWHCASANRLWYISLLATILCILRLYGKKCANGAAIYDVYYTKKSSATITLSLAEVHFESRKN